MDEEPRTPPAPRARTGLLLLAALFCAAAAIGGLLPWHRVQEYDEEAILQGYHFIEGIIELALAGLGAVLFMLLQVKLGTRVRRMAAGAAALCAFGAAVAPLELFARASWVGVRTVIIVGASSSYSGWSYGLYLSMAAGFLAAGVGSVSVSTLVAAPSAPPVSRRLVRRSPPA